jgi:hypothetical protein
LVSLPKLTVVTDLKILIAGKKNVLISDEIFGMMIVLGGAGGLFGGFAYKILGSIAFPIVFVSVGLDSPICGFRKPQNIVKKSSLANFLLQWI